MYRIFAEFDSRAAAERAADRLRGSVPGLGRIAVRAKNGGRDNNSSYDGIPAAESVAFAVNSFFTNSALPVAAALGEERSLSHERYHDRLADSEHILSAEGPGSAAEQAAHLLRSSGGRCITLAGGEH